MNWLASHHLALTDAVVADRSDRGTLVALGGEVVPVLQGVVSSDVFKLANEGRGQRSAAVNAKGRLVCDLRILHVAEMLLMDFEPGMLEDGKASHFRANVITEDARFVDRTAATGRLCVIGPRAAEVVATASDLGADPGTLAVYCATWGSIAGSDVIVQSIPTYGVPAFELYLSADAVNAVAERIGLATIEGEALEALRIEAGVARWGAELDEKVIPLEAGLDDAISYEKGCYVGQEIIARLDTLGTPAKLLRTIVAGNEPLEIGASVERDGKKIGDLRSVTWSPRLGAHVGLAFVKRDHNTPGTVISVGDRQARVEQLGYAVSKSSSVDR